MVHSHRLKIHVEVFNFRFIQLAEKKMEVDRTKKKNMDTKITLFSSMRDETWNKIAVSFVWDWMAKWGNRAFLSVVTLICS